MMKNLFEIGFKFDKLISLLLSQTRNSNLYEEIYFEILLKAVSLSRNRNIIFERVKAKMFFLFEATPLLLLKVFLENKSVECETAIFNVTFLVTYVGTYMRRQKNLLNGTKRVLGWVGSFLHTQSATITSQR